MGIVSYVTKYATGGVRTSIPAQIFRESHISVGDMFIWNYDPAGERFILEIRRIENGKTKGQ